MKMLHLIKKTLPLKDKTANYLIVGLKP